MTDAPPPEDDEAERRRTNLVLLVVVLLLVGGGLWIAHALLKMRKIQDCLGQGRRNCAPIDVPASSR